MMRLSTLLETYFRSVPKETGIHATLCKENLPYGQLQSSEQLSAEEKLSSSRVKM